MWQGDQADHEDNSRACPKCKRAGTGPNHVMTGTCIESNMRQKTLIAGWVGHDGASATFDKGGAGHKNGLMAGTGRMKSWYDRQWQSKPDPRRWLVTAGLAAMVTIILIVLAAMAHGMRSHYSGPPWWSYLIFAVMAAAGVVQNLYRALRDRRRLTTQT